MAQTRSYRENLLEELLRSRLGAGSEGLAQPIELLSALGRDVVFPQEAQRTALRAQLLARHQELSRPPTAWFPVSLGWRWGIAAIVLLLIGALIPAIAQDILTKIRIIEVENTPELPNPADADFVIVHPLEAVPLDELKAVAGFPVFVPSVLPPGCEFHSSYLIREPRKEVRLEYSCFSIHEWKESLPREAITVRQGEVQSLTINGEPALLVKGNWIWFPGLEEPMWEPNSFRLLLEREDVFIYFDVSGGVELEDIIKVQLEDLIKTAESLRLLE